MSAAVSYTIAEELCFSGVGLHSGAPCEVVISPFDGPGVWFHSEDGPVSVRDVSFHGGVRRTVALVGGVPLQTLEHLMAAIWCLGVGGVLVRVIGGEVPIMDGSALPFAMEILRVRVEGRSLRGHEPLRVASPVVLEDPSEGRLFGVYPAEGFKVMCLLDYPGTPLGTVYREVEVQEESFLKSIAPCRTFGFREEVQRLAHMGLIAGGGLHNALVIDGDGPLNQSPSMDFREECVGHKVLDVLGDLAFLGRPLCGAVISLKSGHGIHHRLVGRLRALG